MVEWAIGIDVSKHKLDVCLLNLTSKRQQVLKVSNDTAGYIQLNQQLKAHDIHQAHICIESTGTYSAGVAVHLYEAGYLVSLVNPAETSAFAQFFNPRTKTDKQDAVMLANFVHQCSPRLWQPMNAAKQALRDLQRLLGNLQQDRTRISNRLEGCRSNSAARPHIERQLQHINEQIEQIEQDIDELIDQSDEIHVQANLLTTIKGIGSVTATALLAELPDKFEQYSAKAIAAYAGLCPQTVQSGKICYTYLSKRGNSRLRAALYYPALSAMRWNPHLRVFAERLKAAGKSKMTVVAAVMRKLLILAVAILKSRQPYDPQYGFSA